MFNNLLHDKMIEQNNRMEEINFLNKKISISSKKQVIIILLIFVIPLIVFFVSYNLITMNVLNKRIAETNKNTVVMYQDTVEKELNNIEKFMVDLTAINPDFRQLRNKMSNLNAYLASYNVLEKYKTILNVHPMIGGMFIYSEANQLYRKAYNEGYPYQVKIALEAYLREQTKDEETSNTKDWYVKKIENQTFLFRILGNRGIHTICVVKLDNIRSIQEFNKSSQGFILFSSDSGKPLTMVSKVEERGIYLKDQSDTFYISGEDKKYFIVQNKLDGLGLNMVYIVPHHGVIYNMDRAQVILIMASVLILLLIPVCYKMLQYSYFKPLSQLVKTMKLIKDGKLDAKMKDDYSISEFKQFSDTFNEMMEQIQFFKIAAYEKELESQRAQLQYLQIQIRPHFFLNCLKNIYGMAQDDKRKEIQEMILALSVHSRYMFRDSFQVVPLSVELENVNNYINLQQMSTAFETTCSIDVDAELMAFGVPPISILTFAENSVKHGVSLNSPLKIYIKGRLLRSEEGEYVNITISDNGSGFSQESLLELNNKAGKDNTGEHIGISNVKHRFELIYHNESIISFSNQASGACVEVFIPYTYENNV